MDTETPDTWKEGQTQVTCLDLYCIDVKTNILGGADNRLFEWFYFFFVSNSKVHPLLMTVSWKQNYALARAEQIVPTWIGVSLNSRLTKQIKAGSDEKPWLVGPSRACIQPKQKKNLNSCSVTNPNDFTKSGIDARHGMISLPPTAEPPWQTPVMNRAETRHNCSLAWP